MLALVILSATCAAQQEEATFSTGVSVVNVLAGVRNKEGQIVRNLTQDDFLIEEEGRPQAVRYFAQQTDLPLTLGLLIDTSGSVRRIIDQERNASREFFWQVLRENKDAAFVIHFDHDVELLQDLTGSHRQLDRALDEVETQEVRLYRRRGASPGGYPPAQGGPQRGGTIVRGGTALYDAILLASDELMRKQQGRKALILLTDGMDEGSKVTLNHAIEAAQRADTLIYTIRFEDPAYRVFSPGRRGGVTIRLGPGRPDGRKVLERIAKESGGAYFDVTGELSLERIFRRIEEDLRNQYSLGFTPSATSSAASPGYRKLHVAVKQKGLTVQARDGYYPSK